MGPLEGNVALATGGTSGVGRASAVLFAQKGANVAFTGRRAAEGKAVVAEIEAAGGDALFTQSDLTEIGSIPAIIDEAVARCGGLDCAFNNAGVSGGGPVETLDEPLWDTVIDTNLKAQFFCLKGAGGTDEETGQRRIDCVHGFGLGKHRPAWHQYLERQQGWHRLPRASSGGGTRTGRHSCNFHQPVDHPHRDDARPYRQKRGRVRIAPLRDRRTAWMSGGGGGNGTGRVVPVVGQCILRQRPCLDRGWRSKRELTTRFLSSTAAISAATTFELIYPLLWLTVIT
jgi:hypothetical protein